MGRQIPELLGPSRASRSNLWISRCSSSCRRKRSDVHHGLPRQPPTRLGTQRLTRCRRAYVGRQNLRSSQATLPTRGLIRLVMGSIRPVRRSVGHRLSVRLGSRVPSAGLGQPYESVCASLATKWAVRGDLAWLDTRSAMVRADPTRPDSPRSDLAGPRRSDHARGLSPRPARIRPGTPRIGGQARSATLGSTKMAWRAATVRVSPETAGRIQDPADSQRVCSSSCRAGG